MRAWIVGSSQNPIGQPRQVLCGVLRANTFRQRARTLPGVLAAAAEVKNEEWPVPTKDILTRSIVIQTLGAGLGFLVVVIVAQRFGPSAQGMLATARAWVDMASLVLLAGLPQALMHQVSSGNLNGQIAAKLALAYAAIASLALWICATLFAPLSPPFPETFDRAMLVTAACLATIYGLLRVFVLTSRRFLAYNLLSAAPSGMLVLGVLIIPMADASHLALVIVAVFASCALLAIALVRAPLVARVSEPLLPGNVLRLVQYGSWSFAQQAAAQAAILGCYLLLRVNGNDVIGYFSVVMVIVTLMTLPLSIVGPILFNRWVEEYTASRRTNHFVLATCGFFLLSVAGTIIGLPVIYVGVPIVFGEEFAPALHGCLAIGASTLLLIQRRVLTTAGLAFGMPSYCAMAEAMRGVVTLVVVGTYPTLNGAVAGWCLGEIVGLVMITVALRKRLGLSYQQVLGVDKVAVARVLQYAFSRQPAGLS